MVDEKRIKELEAIDRRRDLTHKVTVAFFVLLSVVLVIYAVQIERKIHRLSESPGVVIYKDEIQAVPSGDEDGINLPTDTSVYKSDVTESENLSDGDTFPVDTSHHIDAASQDSDNSQVFYVTATGRKYHNSGCSYLTDTMHAVSYDEIISGGYTPCSRCIK